MPNIENLIPNEARTPEERRKNAKKAGEASGRARRKKKTMREAAKILMDMDIQNDKTKQALSKLGISENDMNYSMAIMVAMMNEAAKGNVKAAAFIRDTMGDSASHELQKSRLALENKRTEIELLKLESQINDNQPDEGTEDNFLDALNASVAEVWEESEVKENGENKETYNE